MKIAVVGTRGIPDIQGGVETHCEKLYPRLVAMGHQVTLFRRDCYVPDYDIRTEYEGVSLIDIPTPRKKSIEAIVHTFRAIRAAKRLKPDVLHIHAIGPSLLTPLAKMMGMKVVVTNHGPDYDRSKWGRLAKAVLRAGEYAGAKFADRVIVISKTIAGILAEKYNRKDTDLIFNGVDIPSKSNDTEYIESLGLEPRRYVLALGRFVPEKNFDQLIDAFSIANPTGYRLVIAGDADHSDDYSKALKNKAAQNGTVLTGFIKGEKLNRILSNAALFVLPSSHEGLPISLLEAMSYDLDVLCSDIPANIIQPLKQSDFFPVGDTAALADTIKRKLAENATPRSYDLSQYDWDNIAKQTEEVYLKATNK